MCALFGTATLSILTSVLVDRYQRVYNRKMYVSESEKTAADFDIMSDSDDEARSIRSGRDSTGLIRRFSGTKPRTLLSSLQEKRKNDRNQAGKLQFVVSYNDLCATDHIVTMMKRKFAEAILATDVDVNLKLIDDDRRELWTVSSFDSQRSSIPKIRLSTNLDDEEQRQQSKIEVF